MMDVNDGGILGMAVRGGYDLNKPFELLDEEEKKRIDSLPEEEKSKAKAEALERQWRNKAVSDTYMPGSVFKMITTAMGFEENLVNENTNFFCSGSIVPFKGAKPIKCHKHGGHGAQVFARAFCNSCNPAFVNLGQIIGSQKFYQYYEAFGFTEKTGGLVINSELGAMASPSGVSRAHSLSCSIPFSHAHCFATVYS